LEVQGHDFTLIDLKVSFFNLFIVKSSLRKNSFKNSVFLSGKARAGSKTDNTGHERKRKTAQARKIEKK
jgi:hypothetical protein